jgi:hypothetical protein
MGHMGARLIEGMDKGSDIMPEPENLDDKATGELAAAYVSIDDAKKIGFRDGFAGLPGRAVSDFVDQQAAYFAAFKEGRKHREKVDRICKAEGIGIDDLVRKALDHYYATAFRQETS